MFDSKSENRDRARVRARVRGRRVDVTSSPYPGRQILGAFIVMSTSYLGDTQGAIRTESAPLLAGDFVDLGLTEAGTQLNFFLIGNGANGGTNVYTADPTLNSDGTEHFISLAMTAVVDSPYLVIGVEDLYGGGDRDYNDLVFAVDIGYENVAALIAATVPLPLSVYAIFGMLGYLLMSRRRKACANTARP